MLTLILEVIKLYSRRLRKAFIPVIYGVCIFSFLLSMYFAGKIAKGYLFHKDDELEYVDNEITEDYVNDIPVINTSSTIIRPYLDGNVKVAKSFYDYASSTEEQEKAIILYEKTYMQNSGIDYANDELFDVVSILDGTVISVTENDLLGTCVQIKHSNDLISVYQSLSDVVVKENDNVVQGQAIAKSGTANITKDLGNHLHFELYHNGAIVNPDLYYDKSVNDL